ncbi:MAG: ABC transporter permease, partial [Candidatus Aminicenantes bacterium]|nr:ABC transporter permease [Candidatus Aminicenantes bacterium]
RILEALLRFLLSSRDGEPLSGDFSEIYERIRNKSGKGAAVFWNIFHILKLVPDYLKIQLQGSLAMLKNYFKIALRILNKNRGYSVINIVGLAVGMTVCLFIFLWVRDELSYDRFNENIHNIYKVIYKDPVSNEYWSHGCGPVGPALASGYPEITHYTRYFGPVSSPLRFGELNTSADVAGADPGFFNIFTFPFLEGDPETALQKPDSIVLTESTARKYFGNQSPLGQTMIFEWWGTWHDVLVTAVIGDVPSNSHLNFDFLLPISFVTWSGMSITDWNINAYHTYVRLKDRTDFHAVESRISGFMKEHLPKYSNEMGLFPVRDIHLHYFMGGTTAMTHVTVFSFIGFLVLLLAGINFINLTTARSGKRASEVGLRKVVGARRSQLISQFLGESLLLAVLACALSLLAVYLLLPSVNLIVEKQLRLSLSGGLVPVFIGVMLLFGLAAGLYPALYLSSFSPMRDLRLARGSRSGRPLLRRVLVVTQFVISISLIICSITVVRQVGFMRHKDWGITTDHIINFELRGDIRNNNRAIRERLLQNPDIKGITVCNFALNKSFATRVAWEGMDPDEKGDVSVISADYEFQKVFDQEMKEGRYFSREYVTDARSAVVINEEAARRMGMDQPIGRHLSCPLPFDSDREGTIIGVVKDYHFRSLHQPIFPLVMVIHPAWMTDLYIRIGPSDLQGTLAGIEKTMKEMAPGSPFEFTFLDQDIDSLYRTEVRGGKARPLRNGYGHFYRLPG